MGRRHSVGVALLAVLACVTLTAANESAALHARRELLDKKSEDGYSNVLIVNKCSSAVVLKVGYNWAKATDKGKPCPNELPAANEGDSACTSDWKTIDANSSVVLKDLPLGLWWYAAYAEGADPAYYLSKQTNEAFLGGDKEFAKDCNTPDEDTCVWWGVPPLRRKGKLLVLSCPDLEDSAAADDEAAAEESTVEVLNKCSVAVQIKVAYKMTVNDTGAGCIINEWQGKDGHLCVTDWQTLEAGEQRYIAATSDSFWVYGSRIADDLSYDLSKRADGHFQATNSTLACPDGDAYGSGYVCEWWAPNCGLCGDAPAMPNPMVITCDDYKPKKE